MKSLTEVPLRETEMVNETEFPRRFLRYKTDGTYFEVWKRRLTERAPNYMGL